MELTRIPNLELEWPGRCDRVRRVNARIDPLGMTRPARDPGERRFLAELGQLGPFTESAVQLGVTTVNEPEQ